MATLTTLRASLRLDLNDPAGASQRFGDGDLDRAILRAVAEYQRTAPRAMSAQLTTSAGSRRLILTSLGDVVDVWSVEWPTGEWPRRYCTFRLAPDRLSLELLVDAAPAAAELVSIEYGALHTVTTSESSIPAEDEALVLHGAYGYACLAYGTPAADNFRYQDGAAFADVDDSGIIGRWHAAGRAALNEFRYTLAALRHRRAQACQQRAAWRMRDE